MYILASFEAFAPLAHRTHYLLHQFQIICLLVPPQRSRYHIDLHQHLQLRRDDFDHFLEEVTTLPSQKLSLGDPFQLVPLNRKHFALGQEMGHHIHQALQVILKRHL